MASQKQQYTILYGRLSQEDERAGESNSIQHQRDLLEKYARDKGFENTLFLADDGYSGTNFERPSWKKIVEMIEAGEVSTLIVKDASRLGREYLQVGYYMEIYFPQKNVRFIAVNDGVDSAVESSNDFNPIRNWANELHAKDTSRKVRTVKKLQALRLPKIRSCGKPSRTGSGSGGGRAADFHPLCCRERAEPDRADSDRTEYSDTCELLLSEDWKNAQGVRCAASMRMVWYNGQ